MDCVSQSKATYEKHKSLIVFNRLGVLSQSTLVRIGTANFRARERSRYTKKLVPQAYNFQSLFAIFFFPHFATVNQIKSNDRHILHMI